MDDGAGNAWLWTKDHGWLWTGEGLFRYLLRHRDQNWIYYITQKGEKRYFYNYDLKRFEITQQQEPQSSAQNEAKESETEKADGAEDKDSNVGQAKNSGDTFLR